MTALHRLGRLWRTVRWLRHEQLWGRLWFRLHRPRPDAAPAPPLRAASGCWVLPARRDASLLGPGRLRLIGAEHGLDEVGWDSDKLPLLWRYNLHYFDDLNAWGADSRRAWQRPLLERWLADNPAGRGTAFAPYPTSLRIVNWIKWFVGGVQPEPAWLDSLALQARWLERRLEWHLLGNHLFVNAKALVHAGLYFEGPQAQRWLARGLAILDRELDEQILADGGQFERSPMYHLLALEDLLDLLNLMQARADGAAAAELAPWTARLRALAARMLHWARCMRHPSGALVRFNDCAEGIAPAFEEIERLAAALGVTAEPAPAADGVVALQPSGYLRVARGPALAWLDVAPVGPDYLPGHAHADTLGFELSLAGRELIVNRGTSVYGDGPRRQYERGTAAHSCVQLGGHDSSEVWAGFRVGRRARPFDLRVDADGVSAAHDGYRHLAGRPVVRRRWRFDEASFEVHDRVDTVTSAPPATSPATSAATSRFHLAPGLRALPDGDDSRRWRIVDGDTVVARARVLAGRASVEPAEHAQAFGHRVPASTLCLALHEGGCAIRWHWNG
jgi:uncharacterized heparinase superfamily protein